MDKLRHLKSLKNNNSNLFGILLIFNTFVYSRKSQDKMWQKINKLLK